MLTVESRWWVYECSNTILYFLCMFKFFQHNFFSFFFWLFIKYLIQSHLDAAEWILKTDAWKHHIVLRKLLQFCARSELGVTIQLIMFQFLTMNSTERWSVCCSVLQRVLDITAKNSNFHITDRKVLGTSPSYMNVIKFLLH